MVVGSCSNTNEPARSLQGSIAGGAFVTFKATQNIPAPGGKMHADRFCSVGRLKTGPIGLAPSCGLSQREI